MDTILVTGGAGFIGSCLVRRLVRKQKLKIVNLDLLTYAGNLESLAKVADDPLYKFVLGDIGDESLVDSILQRHKPIGVINLAAETHVDRSITDPFAFVRNNVLGTAVLLESSKRYWRQLPDRQQKNFRFLQVSTDEVFGSLGPNGTFSEASPYDPSSPYSASKAGADHLVRAYHRTYRLPTLICNSSNNYGPFQNPEKLIPLTIVNALAGKPLPVYGDGKNVRDWLYVEDHANAIETIFKAGTPGGSWNVGGGNERTNLEVIGLICDAVDQALGQELSSSRKLIQFVRDRPGHDFRYAIDSTKIQNELGWRPEKDFESGIVETVKWYAEK